MKTLLIAFFTFSLSIYSQSKPIDTSLVNRHLKIIENNIERLELMKRVNMEKDDEFRVDVLDEKLAYTYAKEIFVKQNPSVDLNKYSYNIAIQEDKSKKLWIVMMHFPGGMDSFYAYLFVKNNGQLVFYGNHWRWI